MDWQSVNIGFEGWAEDCLKLRLKTQGFPEFTVDGKDIRKSYLEHPDFKWLASSALQKAIRRGETDMAMRLCAALFNLDAGYVTRRLHVVAVEDIGMANPELVGLYAFAANKTVWRTNNGGSLDVILALVAWMSDSLKSREADDLLLMDGMRDPAAKILHEELHDLTVVQLMQAIADPFHDLQRSVVALRYLYGDGYDTKWPEPWLARKHQPMMRQSIEPICEALSAKPFIRWLMETYSSRQRELQWLTLPLVSLRFEVSGDCDVWATDPWDMGSTMVGKFPGYAYDYHNVNGKRALSYFNKSSGLGEWYESVGLGKDRWLDLTGMLVFALEGQCVTRRALNDYTAELLDFTWNARCTREGLDASLIDEAYQRMMDNQDKLNYARRRTVGLV